MPSEHLIETVKPSFAVTSAEGVAAATDLNGTILDMAGFSGVLMIVTFGVITAGAATTIKAQQDTASNMATAADLLGTAQTVADTDDGKVFMIDLKSPAERYVRLVVTRATQNSVVASAIYLQYGARSRPPTLPATFAVEKHLAPAEGTA